MNNNLHKNVIVLSGAFVEIRYWDQIGPFCFGK